MARESRSMSVGTLPMDLRSNILKSLHKDMKKKGNAYEENYWGNFFE